MDYVSKLTEEEARYFCEQVPYKPVKDYFLRYPKDFHRIFPGREAKKLSMQEIRGMLLNSRNKPFISNFLNRHIEISLEIVQEECGRRMKEGEAEQSAILYALLKSEYRDCPELYCKLTNQDISSAYVELMKNAVKALKETIQGKEAGAVPEKTAGNQETPKAAIAQIGMVVEGINALSATMQLAQRYNVEMPIVEQVNKILFEDKPVKDAVLELMMRGKN